MGHGVSTARREAARIPWNSPYSDTTMLTALSLALLSPAPAHAPNPDTLGVSSAITPSIVQASARDVELPMWYLGLGIQGVTTSKSDGPGSNNPGGSGGEIDFNEGIAVPLTLGYRFWDQPDGPMGFSTELDVIYTNQEAEQGAFGTTGVPFQADLTGFNVLLNGVFDAAVNDTVSFYGGAGVGLGWLDVGNENDGASSFSDEDGPFLAWQVKAGVLFRTSDSVAFEVGYRFLNVDDVEFDNDTGADASFELETRQHMLGLGARFTL